MTAPDATVWEDIKHAYIHGREPVVVIAARFGYSLSAIERRRRSESWPMRSARPDYKAFAAPSRPQAILSPDAAEAASGGISQPNLQSPPAPDAAAALSAPKTPREVLVARVYSAMTTKLGQIEHQILRGLNRTLADSERETRMLDTFIRNLEKITEFEASLAHRLPALASNGAAAPGRNAGANGAHAAGTAAATADAAAGADYWRGEIARRLARLQPVDP